MTILNSRSDLVPVPQPEKLNIEKARTDPCIRSAIPRLRSESHRLVREA